jgi:hypothetical protein
MDFLGYFSLFNIFIKYGMVWMCSSATNRLITSKYHALCGFVRAQVDSEIHHLHAQLLVSATWFLYPV